jgi:hypothetical protein
MRYLCLIFALMSSFSGFAQTKLIAYKSHAGDLDFFIPEAQPEDDFGLPPQRIIKIEKLNDSTIVETTDFHLGQVITDTVINHPYFANPETTIEEIKARYYRSDIIFEGFESKKVDKRKAKRLKKKNKNEEKITPPKLLKDKKGRIQPKCEPPTDSSKTLRERASILPIGTNLPPSGGSPAPTNWSLIFGLCFIYFASLAYLVYRRQRSVRPSVLNSSL